MCTTKRIKATKIKIITTRTDRVSSSLSLHYIPADDGGRIGSDNDSKKQQTAANVRTFFRSTRLEFPELQPRLLVLIARAFLAFHFWFHCIALLVVTCTRLSHFTRLKHEPERMNVYVSSTRISRNCCMPRHASLLLLVFVIVMVFFVGLLLLRLLFISFRCSVYFIYNFVVDFFPAFQLSLTLLQATTATYTHWHSTHQMHGARNRLFQNKKKTKQRKRKQQRTTEQTSETNKNKTKTK